MSNLFDQSLAPTNARVDLSVYATAEQVIGYIVSLPHSDPNDFLLEADEPTYAQELVEHCSVLTDHVLNPTDISLTSSLLHFLHEFMCEYDLNDDLVLHCPVSDSDVSAEDAKDLEWELWLGFYRKSCLRLSAYREVLTNLQHHFAPSL